MKRLIICFIVLFLSSCGDDKKAGNFTDDSKEISSPGVSIQSVLSNLDKGNYQENELLVKFKTGLKTTSDLESKNEIRSSVIKRFTKVPNLVHIRLPEGVSVKDAIVTYMSDPNVEYAEPNYVRRATVTIPNDEFFSLQWSLLNTVNPGADIQATDAWDINRGSGNINIAIIDTGLDYNHPDLAGNTWINTDENPSNGIDDDGNGWIDDWIGWNFVADSNDPFDDDWHGTHVGGIAGAVGNNNRGVSGVLWDVDLMPLKILDSEGFGTVAAEIQAIQYAVVNGADIINASFSGNQFSNAEFDAVNSANNAGILFVAAAGSGGDDSTGDNTDLFPVYPAGYQLPNIISVASTDQNDVMSVFSNFGLNTVHVAAPGDDILSTFPANQYAFASGTSMSSPIVAGLAGLLYSQYQNFNYSQIRGTILRYVDILTSLQLIQTSGRINAYRALSSLLQPTGFSLNVLSSSQIGLSWTDNATGEDGYWIDRRTEGGVFGRLANIGVNAQSYTDNLLIDGTTYTYRVKANNTLPNPPGPSTIQAQSAFVEASDTTLLNAPTALSATAVSTSQVNLAWTDNSQTEEGYRIERSDAAGGYVEIAVTGPNITTFIDTGLSPVTSYNYRIWAFNTAAGNSSYSNEASATTLSESDPPPGDGGGGCSITSKQNRSTSYLDFVMVFIPLMIVALMRRRRFQKLP